jgi:hypothetical protein
VLVAGVCFLCEEHKVAVGVVPSPKHISYLSVGSERGH